MKIIDSQVRFVVNIDSKIPNSLTGDQTRIRQVLLNLLSNAVKFTEHGYVSLNLYGKDTTEKTTTLVIEVKDSGHGIKQEDIKMLFGEYVQFDYEKNRNVEGTGLGLAIAWHIVKAMDGTINVESEYGRGSVFTVTLPQKKHSQDILAAVNNPGDINVLIYERRELLAQSFLYALDSLGVSGTIVGSDSQLAEEVVSHRYSFVFIPFGLYGRNSEVLHKYGENVKIVVLADFGTEIPDEKIGVLAMPVYSISISNILNGICGRFYYNEQDHYIGRFTAPSAKILIVDDIYTNLKVAEGLLLPYKMKVDLSTSGRDAIKSLSAKRYDLVFMDHKMPEMDGVETTMHIRRLGSKESYLRDVPIVALTANAVSGIKETFLHSGFNDFLSKPIDIVKLNAVLEKWIPKEKREIVSEAEYKAEIKNRQEQSKNIEFEINGIDTQRGIFLSGGSTELFLETLAIFYKDVQEKIKDIRKCLDNGAMDLYTIYAHALKSACSNVGAVQLSETAKSLEAAGDRADLKFIEANTPAFLASLELLAGEIKSALDTKKGEGAGKKDVGQGDIELLTQELEKLKSGLETLDAGIINLAVENLKNVNISDDIETAINDISDKILIGEYEEAADAVNALLKA
jgi:CheY-like chemotaxis protein/HPt (histidine-containing phosphotransfer) domain-containing protein